MTASDDRGVGEHRRDRESGRLVYPVISRRSGGLSVGINLFPDRKTCSFDCPYCEVFPFPGAAPFDAAELESELGAFLDEAYPASWAPEPVRDLCLSGNGEPTLSPGLAAAIDACARARRARPALLGTAELVVITNSAGFLDPEASAILERAVRDEGLRVWAKLDGGSPEAFARMSRSAFALEEVAAGIADFASRSPLVIQTMLCEVSGEGPSDAELRAYAELVSRLERGGARISAIQLYTQARPSPEGLAAPIGDGRLAELAAAVAGAVAAPVRAYGRRGQLDLRAFRP